MTNQYAFATSFSQIEGNHVLNNYPRFVRFISHNTQSVWRHLLLMLLTTSKRLPDHVKVNRRSCPLRLSSWGLSDVYLNTWASLPCPLRFNQFCTSYYLSMNFWSAVFFRNFLPSPPGSDLRDGGTVYAENKGPSADNLEVSEISHFLVNTWNISKYSFAYFACC